MSAISVSPSNVTVVPSSDTRAEPVPLPATTLPSSPRGGPASSDYGVKSSEIVARRSRLPCRTAKRATKQLPSTGPRRRASEWLMPSARASAARVGEALLVAGALSGPGQAERVVETAVRELGGLDCLVNNVGVARIAKFEEVSDDEWNKYWQLNVMSYIRAIRAALPALRERGGAIVNVSSTAGKRPSTGMPHYSVVKAAVLSLSRLIADLYANDGIRCNAVTPGPTATEAWLADGGLADQN